jgi:hypothetical protein
VGFSDDQLMAREMPDLRESARGLSDDDLLRREGLAPPRAKPEPPHVETAGEQYARGLAAGHFKEGEETPLTRTLRAGQQQMDEPGGYMDRALNAWQAMAAQGAGEVAKVGANALGIETGPPEQAAGELMSALPGLVGAEGAPHPREMTRAAPRAEPIAPPRAEPIPPRVPDVPSARPAGEPIPPRMPGAPSEPQTVLLNIAKGRPADAPPVEQAPVARGARTPAGTRRSCPGFRRS